MYDTRKLHQSTCSFVLSIFNAYPYLHPHYIMMVKAITILKAENALTLFVAKITSSAKFIIAWLCKYVCKFDARQISLVFTGARAA